jgi:hypothetical protein
MACGNTIMTVLAAIILIANVWPNIVGAEATKWVTIIAAVVLIVAAWTVCDCRLCGRTPAKKK